MAERIGLAEMYLTFLQDQPSLQIKKAYLKCVKEISPEQFSGTGWSLYKQCYDRICKQASGSVGP